MSRVVSAHKQADLSRSAAPRRASDLTGRQKAAIIVRLMLAEGAQVPLAALPDHLQAALTEQISLMRAVDRDILRAVVEEFVHDLERVGLSFPGGIENALSLLDGHISPSAASRLRRLAGASSKADPWERLATLDPERLLLALEAESIEVGAVILSKLAVPKAAELLGRLPGDRARRIAYAVSLTGNVDPETVRQIGLSLVAQFDAVPPKAFDTGPVERVGAILNFSPAATRDAVMVGLAETDSAFADLVRRAIFTFADIPDRLDPRDVPKITRAVPQPTLVTALAAALAHAGAPGMSPENGTDAATADFILSALSQRMQTSLREEMEARGTVKDKDAEEAMNAIIAALRDLEGSGDIVLIQKED